MSHTKLCEHCRKPFVATRTKRFCSKSCGDRFRHHSSKDDDDMFPPDRTPGCWRPGCGWRFAGARDDEQEQPAPAPVAPQPRQRAHKQPCEPRAPKPPRLCATCGLEFVPKRKKSGFCSRGCSARGMARAKRGLPVADALMRQRKKQKCSLSSAAAASQPDPARGEATHEHRSGAMIAASS